MRRILISMIISAMAAGCGSDSGRLSDPRHVLTIEELTADTVSEWDHPLRELPEPTRKMRINNIGPLAKVFNDSNYVHWDEAKRIGIRPLDDLRSYWEPERDLVKVVSCEDFYVEPPTHSRPFLIPEGAAMLHEIGRRFRDSLEARGGGDYRIKVTSVLRTPPSIRRLRRANRNAVDSSVHQFGTTVDISYSRFAPDSDRIPRSMEDLKNLLGEVLWAMRAEGKCYVKYERKQPCFHITVREGAYSPAESIEE